MASCILSAVALALTIPVATSLVPPNPRCSNLKRISCSRESLPKPLFLFFPDRADNTNQGKDNGSTEIDFIEKEVLASTQARLDMKRVTDVLLEEDSGKPKISSSTEQKGTAQSTTEPPSTWTIALASAFVSSLAANLVLHSWIISAAIFVVAFVVASGDPLDEEGIAGSLARIVGRTTLKSIDTAKPKIRAVARAAVTGEEELASLMNRLSELEEENAELRLWVQRRKAVDESLSRFTLEELKELARKNGVIVGGTKSQLLMRLVEEGAIDLTS